MIPSLNPEMDAGTAGHDRSLAESIPTAVFPPRLPGLTQGPRLRFPWTVDRYGDRARP
jgi:hypothetical protein